MKVHTFEAGSLKEAIQKVKAALGRDALILTTRSYIKGGMLGIGGRPVVEVTAIPGSVVERKPRRRRRPKVERRSAPPPVAAAPAKKDNGPEFKKKASGLLKEAYALLESRESASPPVEEPAEAEPRLEAKAEAVRKVHQEPADSYTPSVSPVVAKEFTVLNSLERQMGQMKELLETMVPQVHGKQIVPVPMEYEELYRYLLDQSITEKIARDLTLELAKNCRPRGLELAELLLRITDRLENVIDASGPITRPSHGPKTVAFIGPTGVGKTTTIAKIAAILKFQEKVPVGLITIDTYRIAAVQQLQTYADIMKIPCRSVLEPLDLRRAIGDMRNYEVILIDTAGRSQRDEVKMDELTTFLNVGAPTETHLVISSTSHPKAIREVVDLFGRFRLDRLLFTKIDEAVLLGPLLEVIMKVKKPISYITTGQEVPEDIEVVESRKFARMLLGEVA
ncbi:MAG: flagellar biosynthesis protein FlhF [Planctomycetota bacterium]|nr:MAG: flagellar biosynthesis protein FlhF [Planctomycetota bacterium]